MIIDTADDTTKKLAGLKKAGCDTVIRYDCRIPSGGWKQIHAAEAKAIADAKMRLGIVYEDRGASVSSFSESTGFLSATYSRKMAAARGQPGGSAVYFAVDFDASSSEIRGAILPYFKGVYAAMKVTADLPLLRVGAYCSGLCAEMLRAIHPDILVWITCSSGFQGTKAFLKAKKHDLWQSKCETSFGGMKGVDLNEAQTEDWGWFVPWGSAKPPKPPKPPLPIKHDVAWLQKILANKNYGYSGEIDGDAGAGTIAAMIKYAEWHELG